MTQLQIDCFLAAVRTGSQAAAAREMYLSVQVVSRHIRALEEELSVQLFERGSGGVTLTDDGQRFLMLAGGLTRLYADTVDTIQTHYESLACRFSVGISDYINVLGPIRDGIAAFAASRPETELSCVQYAGRDLLRALADGTIDAAIISGSQVFAGSDYRVFPFAEEDLRLFVSHRSLPENCTLRQAVALCGDLPHLDCPYGSWLREEWDEISARMNEKLGLGTLLHYSLPNFRSVVSSVRTMACTAVSDARFGYLHEDDDLRSFPLQNGAKLCIVSSERNENPVIGAFCSEMKKYYAEHAVRLPTAGY